MNPWYTSPLPHPDDQSIGTRRPFQKQEGVYIFKREPFDTEIFWIEPDGSSYILAYFDAGMLMKTVLKMTEEFHRWVLDTLWSFHTIAVSLDPERVISLRESDAPGWEKEIQMQFNEG